MLPAGIVLEIQQRFGATKIIGSAGMPQMERSVEAIKRLEGVHVLKYLKPSTAQPGVPLQRPYHQLNNVGSSPCSLLLEASSLFLLRHIVIAPQHRGHSRGSAHMPMVAQGSHICDCC